MQWRCNDIDSGIFISTERISQDNPIMLAGNQQDANEGLVKLLNTTVTTVSVPHSICLIRHVST